FSAFLLYSFQMNDFADDLHFGIVLLQFADFVVARTVNIAVGKQVNQILKRVDTKLFTQQIGTIGTNAFKVIYGSLQEIRIHRTKIAYSIRNIKTEGKIF